MKITEKKDRDISNSPQEGASSVLDAEIDKR